jgi:hypothetical protein
MCPFSPFSPISRQVVVVVVGRDGRALLVRVLVRLVTRSVALSEYRWSHLSERELGADGEYWNR